MGSDHNQAIKDWLETADRNLTAFTKSPLHERLLTRRRAIYTAVFGDKEQALSALAGLFKAAHKAEPFDLRMSRTQAPFGCWELGTQTKPHTIVFTVPGQKEKHTELAYCFVYSVVNAQLLNTEDLIRHTCDNRKCFRPDHLLVGTAKQNRLDDAQRIYAGRGSGGKGQIIEGEIARGVAISIFPQPLSKGHTD